MITVFFWKRKDFEDFMIGAQLTTTDYVCYCLFVPPLDHNMHLIHAKQFIFISLYLILPLFLLDHQAVWLIMPLERTQTCSVKPRTLWWMQTHCQVNFLFMNVYSFECNFDLIGWTKKLSETITVGNQFIVSVIYQAKW